MMCLLFTNASDHTVDVCSWEKVDFNGKLFCLFGFFISIHNDKITPNILSHNQYNFLCIHIIFLAMRKGQKKSRPSVLHKLRTKKSMYRHETGNYVMCAIWRMI